MKYTLEGLKLAYDMWMSEYPDNFVYFWHEQTVPDNMNGCLSQWYPCTFYIDEQKYHCTEQFMMAEKARVFGDMEIYNKICIESDPKKIKQLGRMVKNFDEKIWSVVSEYVVFKANMAKFGQNAELREFLFSTGDKVLAEASPKDTIWGIGMDEANAKNSIPHQWKGENRLGFILMEVRETLSMMYDKAKKMSYDRKYTSERISELKPDEIFVFGSNIHGMHGGGAARVAYNQFGAEWGIGEGLTGQCYALPTMEGGVDYIGEKVQTFLDCARQHPDLTFLVTRIACGIAGFRDEEIAPLFKDAIELQNVILPESFVRVIES